MTPVQGQHNTVRDDDDASSRRLCIHEFKTLFFIVRQALSDLPDVQS